MFITIEDETGVANLVIWPTLYEKQRRVILAARMLAVEGRLQREGDVVHLVAYKLFDLSADLANIGSGEDAAAAFPLPHGRGDEFHRGSAGPDPRDAAPRSLAGKLAAAAARDIYVPDLHIDTLKLKTRDFR
jgi:error-prone DNA polymerase